MKKPASLATVLEVSTLRRDDALQALVQARREHAQAEQQMAQLRGYTQESLDRWQARARQGVSPMLLQAQQQFMAKLDHAIGFQDGVLERTQKQIERCEQKVQQAERDLAALKKYDERREETWQKQLQHQEQKNNDEMAANLHRQHRASPDHEDLQP